MGWHYYLVKFSGTWIPSSWEPVDSRAIGSPAGAVGWPDRRECWLKGDWSQSLAFRPSGRLVGSLVEGWQSHRVSSSSEAMSMCHNVNPVLWEWRQSDAASGKPTEAATLIRWTRRRPAALCSLSLREVELHQPGGLLIGCWVQQVCWLWGIRKHVHLVVGGVKGQLLCLLHSLKGSVV